MKIIVLLFCFFLSLSPQIYGSWVPAKLRVTADNGYAVYAGSSKALMYLGSDWAESANDAANKIGHYPVGPFGKYDNTPAAIPLYLDESEHSIYIVTWSDARGTQGGLFDVVINGVQISPDNSEWKVSPTGYFDQPNGESPYPPPTPSCGPSDPAPTDRAVQFGQDFTAPPCPDWVRKAIGSADNSQGWVTPSRGDLNDGSSLIFPKVANIPEVNKWMWFNYSKCPDTVSQPFDNSPKQECEHLEPLIFAIPISAVGADPEACAPRFNPKFNTQFCAGQCPFNPYGTSPNCDTIFTDTGILRGCECCAPCEVVPMANPLENYCSGFCPNCQQCLPYKYGYLNPDNPSSLYIQSCSCQSTTPDGPCQIDRCNNKCTGQCPDPRAPCSPVYNSLGQVIDCNCTYIGPCAAIRSPVYGLLCTGNCTNANTECKGYYVNGFLQDCTCDCCDLYRDPNNPDKNYCEGKCDDANAVCTVTSAIIDPNTGAQIITGCGCK